MDLFYLGLDTEAYYHKGMPFASFPLLRRTLQAHTPALGKVITVYGSCYYSRLWWAFYQGCIDDR